MTSASPDWIAVDWGTSSLRVWALRGGVVVAQAQSDDGMGGLAPDQFAPAFAKLIADWDITPSTPVIACGMVGSRQGWVEAPYRTVPCTPLGHRFASPPDDAIHLHVIAGLRQNAPADVMRGEETQIAGFLALNKDWDGVICLPGTHTKWVEVSAGEVISFQTFMSGELFALLSGQSVLRHSVATTDWDADAFTDAVEDAIAKPERLAARLFSIRASDLLNGTPYSAARATLSGQLIGAELAAARPYWLGRQIAVVGSDTQAGLYRDALAAQGVPVLLGDAQAMTLAGLTAAYRLMKEKK